MLFQVNRPTVKICPPLVITEEAAREGIQALEEALEIITN
jgi:4-aminobutyrate aminotransferase-like enzyme